MRFSNSLRDVFFSITICAVGLSLLAASGQAQNMQSKQVQKREHHDPRCSYTAKK